jgi:hypothetical protein
MRPLRLNEQRYGLGLEFLSEVISGTATVSQAPDRWPEIEPGIRRYRIRRFKYAIIYRIRADHVEVIAVMHLARMPGYWRGRTGG